MRGLLNRALAVVLVDPAQWLNAIWDLPCRFIVAPPASTSETPGRFAAVNASIRNGTFFRASQPPT